MKRWSTALILVVLIIAGGIWGYRSSHRAVPVKSASVQLTPTDTFMLGFEFSRQGPITWAAAASLEADLLAVYDPSSHQIRTYTLKGVPIGAFGTEGMQPGQFVLPSGLAVDAKGRILVADAAIPVIRRYTRDGAVADETAPLAGVKGWFDVAVDRYDRVVAAPAPEAALIGKHGVYRFESGGPKALCESCFGPVAVDARNNVYLVNLGNSKESAYPNLMGMSSRGRTLFSTQHADDRIKSDLLFWPEAGCLVLVNAGGRRVEAYRTDGTSLPVLLAVPKEESPPIAAIPLGNSLFVIHHNGQVRVYHVAFEERGA